MKALLDLLRAAFAWGWLSSFPRRPPEPTPAEAALIRPLAAGLGLFLETISKDCHYQYHSARAPIKAWLERQRTLRGPQRPAPFPITLQKRADGLTYVTPKGNR